MSNIRTDYQKMAKPREIEEIWDIYFIRPAGFLLVQFFRRTGITPNMVSLLSVLAAWWCAYFFYQTAKAGNDLRLSLCAGLLMFLHSALDSADGQLARVTGQGSAIGRTIDGFCDNLSFIAIYFAILFGHSEYAGEIRLEILLLAILAGASHSIQAALADFQRCLFLYHVYDRYDIEKESRGSFKKILTTKLHLFDRLLIYLHLNYLNVQHTFCRSSETLKQKIVLLLKDKNVEKKDISLVYAGFQTRMLKGWALLASNSHKFGVVLAAFFPVGPDSFFGEFGLLWFWFYELMVLNICMIMLISAQKRIDHKIYAALLTKR